LSLIRIRGASVILFCAVKGDEFSEFSVPDSMHFPGIFLVLFERCLKMSFSL
jgi:hypothetical protein